MNFKEFDKANRKFEDWGNRPIPPENYIIVRLDGRGFSRLTKEVCPFARPFDAAFRDLMVDTTEYIYNNSGFHIAYAYTQSDEISVFLELNDDTFNRRPKKITTTLAGMASAYFSIKLNQLLKTTDMVAVFDATLDVRPNVDRVVDYFRWRQEDSARNSLNGYAYWTLRDQDKLSARKASSIIDSESNSFKNELLFKHGINFDKVDSWKKRGVALYRVEIDHYSTNPLTGERVLSKRKVIEKNYELPMKDEYNEYVRQFII